MHSPKDVFEKPPQEREPKFNPGDHVRCPDDKTGVVLEVNGRQVNVHGRYYPAALCKLVPDDAEIKRLVEAATVGYGPGDDSVVDAERLQGAREAFDAIISRYAAPELADAFSRVPNDVKSIALVEAFRACAFIDGQPRLTYRLALAQ
jgi:hypothetical protein